MHMCGQAGGRDESMNREAAGHPRLIPASRGSGADSHERWTAHALQQPQLLARACRPAERRRAERRQLPVEPVLPRGDGEELGDLLGVLALAALAPVELRVAQPSRPDLADAAEHALASLRV